ncbi:MFS transporter [Buchnera aphidicola]|uniref:MFS transporter n=1 Tax=Buchnera aphidicola subsp. Uroleucon sonchi TaxID=118118 RepID=A0A6C1FC78_BUCUN|nr:MFS transporter [Buchnera aphidicola]QIE02150.1 MFS transporter [Buchnera aphidicola (Uroleucon sonchi)]
MNFLELQVTLSFCIIFFLRMLGMFMVVPVLSKYGMFLDGGNKFLIGLSIGIYGIAQVLFQIPFGILFDRFNRKKIILMGLFVFLIGNIISASIHSIWGLIIGRFLQGSGAISGVCMAYLSDYIREAHRVKSIAAIGVSFAVSFLISIISGPLIIQKFGFFAIFWIASCLSIICMIIVIVLLPVLQRNQFKKRTHFSYKQLLKLFLNKIFFRSYMGIFFLHCILMINFMIIPNQLEILGCILSYHWKIYLYTILISFLILFFFTIYCKNQFILKNIIEISIFLILISECIILLLHSYLFGMIIFIQIFFISFNFLEVFLSSNISNNISKNYKGSAMSIYSTSQFLGIAFGGIFSGWIYSVFTLSQICLLQIFIVLIWYFFSFFCKK